MATGISSQAAHPFGGAAEKHLKQQQCIVSFILPLNICFGTCKTKFHTGFDEKENSPKMNAKSVTLTTLVRTLYRFRPIFGMIYRR